jgi:hypothetical protein
LVEHLAGDGVEFVFCEFGEGHGILRGFGGRTPRRVCAAIMKICPGSYPPTKNSANPVLHPGKRNMQGVFVFCII